LHSDFTGVVGTFVAIVYLGSVAQEVLRQMGEETEAEEKGCDPVPPLHSFGAFGGA
jgi:hypothetical protein